MTEHIARTLIIPEHHLNASVVAIASRRGWPLSEAAAVGIVARAVTWLNEARAPAGRHFVLEDSLYLIEDPGV